MNLKYPMNLKAKGNLFPYNFSFFLFFNDSQNNLLYLVKHWAQKLLLSQSRV